MRTTYATLSELNMLYSSASDYTTEAQENAQTLSFELVNSFLNSTLNIPPTGQIGILKIAQAKFYQWILETSNIGYTEELTNLYNANAEMLKGIQQDQLTVPGYQYSNENAGYHIVEQSSAAGILHIMPNQLPNYPAKYKIVITTGGAVRSGNVRYSVYRDDDISTAVQTNITAKFELRTLFDGYAGTLAFLDSPTVLFNGTFVANDYFWIECVPQYQVDTAPPAEANKSIVQGRVVY